ncbi:MAG: DUF167 domain-containing protein [Phycisphaerales bacterium]
MTSSSVIIRVKAVPGASGDTIAGVLGDRLKIRTSAPPEGGKANKAIRLLIARSLNIRPAQSTLVAGSTSPEKRIAVSGLTIEQIGVALGIDANAVAG